MDNHHHHLAHNNHHHSRHHNQANHSTNHHDHDDHKDDKKRRFNERFPGIGDNHVPESFTLNYQIIQWPSISNTKLIFSLKQTETDRTFCPTLSHVVSDYSNRPLTPTSLIDGHQS